MGSKNPLSCGAQCSRITLITVNVIFLLCGIALFVLGLVFRFGDDSTIGKEFQATLEKVKIDDYDLHTLIDSLTILFIIVGAVIIGFAILGFVGAVCYVRCALVLYAILLGLCLAVELAGVILYFIMRNKLETGFKKGMQEVIIDANKAGNGSESLKATHYFFKTFECCHVSSTRLNATPPGESTVTCSTSSNAYQKDCYDAFVERIKAYQGAFVGIGIAVMVSQVILIILAIWICRIASRKEELV